ncbi:MAG: hypothetical protein PHD05_03695 [Sphaerochaetaceae bacterium]|nr:hypothetical protein [Sphaerochaetaceae bacterium]
MKKKILFLIYIFICVMSLFAERKTLQESLPSLSIEKQSEILSGKTLQISTSDGDLILPFFVPDSNGYNNVNKAFNDLNSFFISSVKLFPYPENWKDKSEYEVQLSLFNTLRQISSQKGIKYISRRAGNKEKDLFSESYYLSDPNDMNSKILDPVSNKLNKNVVSYVYQKDSAFNSNVYIHSYENSISEILLKITNFTDMKYLIFTGIEKGKLNMFFDVQQIEEGILFTTMTSIQDRKPKMKILFYTVDLNSSFSRRMEALQSWFEQRLKLS